MDSDRREAPIAASEATGEPTSGRRDRARKRRIGSVVFLVVGLGVALYFAKVGPQEQHLRIVLGDQAPAVTAVDLQYMAADGDVARDAHFAYAAGAAPRIVAHEPQLANGEYRLQIEVDAHGGRRTIQRRVTLGGGSTQVDISSALGRDSPDPKPEP